MKTVLLTGFEPFGGDPFNPSGEIARQLDRAIIAAHKVIGAVLLHVGSAQHLHPQSAGQKNDSGGDEVPAQFGGEPEEQRAINDGQEGDQGHTRDDPAEIEEPSGMKRLAHGIDQHLMNGGHLVDGAKKKN